MSNGLHAPDSGQPPTRLGEIATLFAGIGVSREETLERPGEKLPMIGVRDLQEGRVAPIDLLDEVGFTDLARAGKYAVQLDDVLVTGRGTVLKFALVGPETVSAIASANVIIIRANSRAAVGGCLYAILSSEAFRPKIEILRRGATSLLSLSPKDLAKIEVDLPPFPEQRRVAALVEASQEAYRTAIEAAEIRRRLARGLIDAQLYADNKRH